MAIFKGWKILLKKNIMGARKIPSFEDLTDPLLIIFHILLILNLIIYSLNNFRVPPYCA